ncbi:MFS transporter [Pleomorphovibrio marinus]|uniref:MFS transporter n=1 Tax=Pleomorphovibrio marinus TaxID=2164132 RepID=UPI000E0C8B3C|nr:MFS transporter [Pleomorphovibrio marinus]
MHVLRKRRWAVGSLFFISGLYFSSWASRIPDFQKSFNLSEGQLGTLLLGLPTGSLIALPLAAWAVYKFGSKVVILLGITFYMLALILLGLAGSSIQLAFFVVGFGLMGNLMNISLNTQAIDIEDGYGRSIMNSFHGLWSLAGFTGAGVGALMVYLGWDPFFHYLLVAAIGLIVVFIAASFLRPENQNSGQSNQLVFKRPDPLLLRIGLVGFCGMLCEGCMFDWSGVFFSKVVQVAPTMVPLGFFAFMGAMASGRFLADKISNSLGKIAVLQISGAMISAGLIISTLFPNLWSAIFGFSLVGLGTASVIPLSYSIAGRSSNYPPSIAIAMVSTLSFFGFLVGPPLIGFIAEIFNLKISFLLIAVMGSLIGLLVSIRQQVFAVGIKS